MNISKLVVDLLLERPFFGVILSKLRLQEDTSIPTACTDGRSIWFNPVWVDTLQYYEQLGLLAHEVMHVVFKHQLRQGGRENRRWNVACDMTINSILLDSGFQIPKDGFQDDHTPPRSAEEIYETLDPNMFKNSPQWGEVKPYSGGNTEEEEQQITLLVAEALRRSSGKMSPALERAIKPMVEKTVSWESLLRDYITSITRDAYSMLRYNRRYIQDNIYLPTLHSKTLDAVVVLDTSGSINTDMLSTMVALIEDVRAEIPTTVRVFSCDDGIRKEEFFDTQDTLKLTPVGGGGTDFRPVFTELEKRGDEPAVLIYLTDGYGTYPDKAQITFPVVWVYVRNKSAGVEIEVW